MKRGVKMIYVIYDPEDETRVLFVKAADLDEVKSRLRLNDSVKLLGILTQVEVEAMMVLSFAIVKGSLQVKSV